MAELNPIKLWHRLLALPAESQAKTIAMAFLVSAVSALVVSVAAVTLQPSIDENKRAEQQAKLDAMIASSARAGGYPGAIGRGHAGHRARRSRYRSARR